VRRRLLAWLARRPEAEAWALLGPGTFWMLVFFVVPVIVMCAYSFMPRGTYGGVDPGFTLEAYTRFLHPVYLVILERTFVIAVLTTVFCVLAGYPVAYAIRVSLIVGCCRSASSSSRSRCYTRRSPFSWGSCTVTCRS
jgi:spermidine/putrescine transport system permease protein